MGSSLIEREAELAAIDAATRQAEAGEGTLLVISGPAGIGKTALLDHTRERARSRGFSVLTAHGGELETDIGFGVVRQLLERPLADLPEADREGVLSGPASLALPVLGSPGHPFEDAGLDHGLYWVVVNLAERGPIALIVDDAHWADAASLRFLAYLARRIEGLPVLVAAAARPREPGAEQQLVGMLASTPGSLRLEPTPLSEDGVARLFGERLGSAEREVVVAGHRMSGGNPYFLTEIAESLKADGSGGSMATDRIESLAPRTITRTLLLRLGGLGPPARAVAYALAVVGDDARVDDLARVADVDRDQATEALVTLADAGIAARASVAAFAHPIVRTAIYGDLGEAQRSRLHERAARALEERGERPDQVAHHLALTAPAGDPRVAVLLHDVGSRALAAGATEAARALLRRALDEPPALTDRIPVLLDLGRAELGARQPGVAEGHLRDALSLCEPGSLRTDVALALSRAVADRAGTAAMKLLDGEMAVATGDDRLRLEVQRTSQALFEAELAPDANIRLRELGQLAGDTPGERLALASAAVAVSFDPGARAAEAAAIARRALRDGALVDDRPDDFVVPYMAMYALTMAEELEVAEREAKHGLADSRARGFRPGFMGALIDLAEVHTARGDLVRAAADAEAALEATLSMEPTPVVLRCLAFATCRLVESQIHRGDLAGARLVLERAAAAGDLEQHELTWVRYARGLAALADAGWEAARDDFLGVGAVARAAGYEDRTLPWRIHLARAHSMLGEQEEALELADEQLALARRWGTPWSVGAALRVRAIVGPPGEAASLLGQAVAELRESAHRVELAGALLDQGRALRRAGKRVDARRSLENALELAARCEALALVEATRDELKRLGARPRRLAFSGIEGLTATERRIAGMAAGGMTNREIAQALFVTIKTVESHLGSTYRKLGVGSRRELPAQLAETA